MLSELPTIWYKSVSVTASTVVNFLILAILMSRMGFPRSNSSTVLNGSRTTNLLFFASLEKPPSKIWPVLVPSRISMTVSFPTMTSHESPRALSAKQVIVKL